MIKAKAVHLEKFILYDRQSYEFKDGITVIRGENRSGKSLLFSAIGNLRYGAPPISNSRGKAKNMHTRNGSKVQFDFESGGRDIKIIQALSASTVKYSIIVDDKDLGSLNQSAALEIMEEYLTTPEDLFYSSFYIAGARRHPLHIGSGADRMRYLENMFDFHSFDSLRDRLKKMLQSAQSMIAESEALKAELSAIPTGKVLEQNTLQRLSSSIEYLKRQTARQNDMKRMEGERDALFNMPYTDRDTDTLKRMKKETEDRLEKARESLRKAEDEQFRAREKDRLSKEIFDLSEKLKSHPPKKGFSIDKKYIMLRKMESSLTKMKYDLSSMKTDRRTHSEAISEFKQLGLSTSAEEFYSNNNRDRLRSVLSEYSGNRSGVRPGSICPTCKQKVRQPKTKITEEEFRSLSRQLEVLESNVFVPGFSEDSIASLTERINKTGRRISETRKEIENYNRRRSLTERINKTRKEIEALGPSSKASKSNAAAVVSSLSKKLPEIERAIEARTRIDFLNSKILADNNINLTGDMIDTLADKYAELRSESNFYRKTEKRRREILNRLAEVEKFVDREEILAALVEAYGPKGLRVNQMTEIARVLERSFNRFSPLIFPEPTYFSMGVAPSQVSVMVENNSLPPSDSSSLSGSEIHCFQILCYAALSPYIPSRYRFDSVVLDEVEAMMTPETRKLFIESAIPEIKKSVRSLTVVTPLPEEEMFIEADRSMQVVKERARSSIIEVSR